MKTERQASAREIDKYRRYAKAVIRHHIGGRPRRVTYNSGGLSNYVFSVNHSDGDFVVRIAPDQGRIKTFIKEQWAQKAARDAGVPVPAILEVGLETIGLPYMISTTVAGTSATHHPERHKILREMGRHAAAINSIRTSGFGETFDWSENQLSLNASFKDYLLDEFCYKQRLDVLERHRMLEPKRVTQISRIFASAASGTDPKPVLNHGDLRLKNVIVDGDGRINAILDWEKCTSNIAPQWEISLALHDLGIDGKQHFIDGYGLTPKRLIEIMPLAKAFNIANYAPAVERASKKNKHLLEQFKIRLSGAIDMYSF